MHQPPKKITKGIKYLINGINGLIDFVTKTRVIPTVGWTETSSGLLPPQYSGGGGLVCKDLKVKYVNDSSEAVQNAGVFYYAGTKASGFTGILSGTKLADGETVANGDMIVLKIEYQAVDETAYGTPWQLDDVTFEVQSTFPTDITPAWDDSVALEWSNEETAPDASGIVYYPWATIDARDDDSLFVSYSNCGSLLGVICSPTDIKISKVITQTVSGFIPPTSSSGLVDGELWNNAGTPEIYTTPP